MPLTQTQILQLKKKLQAQGMTNDQIEAGIMQFSNQYSGGGQQTTPAMSQQTPTPAVNVQQSTQNQPKQANAPQPSGLVGNFFKSLYQPFQMAQNAVGEAANVVTTPGMIKSALNMDLTDEELQSVMNYQPKYLDEKIVEDRGELSKYGAKTAAGIGAYAIPAGGSVKAAAGLGAVAGGLSSYANDEDIVTGAAIGGVTGGAFNVVGKGLRWATKARGGTEEVVKEIKPGRIEQLGKFLREDATQIKQKASVYGAKKEKLIQETLDTLGIVGGPQQKYEQLEPVMGQLGQQIDEIIKANPNKTVDIEDLTKIFNHKIKSEIRTKSLTSNTAKQEIEGYVGDLLREAESEGSTQIGLDKLFKLKKLVNKDYGSIATKLENATPLTDREKVVYYARQVLDQAMTEQLPQVKELTVMQSHLYDAARSLSAARGTVPTFRIAGFTVPQHRRVQDFLGRQLVAMGKLQSKAGENAAFTTKQIQGALNKLAAGEQSELYDLVTRVGIIGSAGAANASQGINTPSENPQQYQQDISQTNYSGNNQNQTNNNLQNNTQSDNSVAQPFGGRSKGELLQLALAEGASLSDLKEIGDIYDLIVPLAEEETAKEKTLSVTAENKVQLGKSGLRALDSLEQIMQDRPSAVFLSKVPGQLGARDYDSAAFKSVEALLRARSGAAIPEEEVRRYMRANLPRLGDSQETIQSKLQSLRRDLEDVATTGGTDLEQRVDSVGGSYQQSALPQGMQPQQSEDVNFVRNFVEDVNDAVVREAIASEDVSITTEDWADEWEAQRNDDNKGFVQKVMQTVMNIFQKKNPELVSPQPQQKQEDYNLQQNEDGSYTITSGVESQEPEQVFNKNPEALPDMPYEIQGNTIKFPTGETKTFKNDNEKIEILSNWQKEYSKVTGSKWPEFAPNWEMQKGQGEVKGASTEKVATKVRASGENPGRSQRAQQHWNQGNKNVVLDAIEKASKRYGVPADMLSDIASYESSLSPTPSANPNSSAGGLFQMTDDTWTDMKRAGVVPQDASKTDPYYSASAAAYLLSKGLGHRWWPSMYEWPSYYDKKEVYKYFNPKILTKNNIGNEKLWNQYVSMMENLGYGNDINRN